ncbi:MAG: proline dehydrogenase family protein [Planctomycetota bacterium]|nr:proline dehydrogenase family protein [Planctomycetota bacterium]
MIRSAPIESEVQRIGRSLFAQVKSRKNKSAGGWWNSKLIDYAMSDPALKIQLFRFTDVLPSLRSSAEVGRHLKEYFDSPTHKFPSFMSWGASLAAFSSLAAMASAAAIRKSVEDTARTFIAGRTPKEAIDAIVAFRKKGLAVTLDALGEAVVSEGEADEYLAKYMELLDALAAAAPKWKADPRLDANARGPIPRINLSVKISSLYSQIDPLDPLGSTRGVEKRLLPLLDRAKAAGAFVNVDMEDYHLKDLTLAIFKDVAARPAYRAWPDLGIVIQAYLKDSEKDLAGLIAWAKQRGAPITVRLVKGAYWDYEGILAEQHGWPCPVFMQKHETDANFEKLARMLLGAYPHLEAAIASHNVRSLAAALACATENSLPSNAFEIQALYGMADPMKEALAEDGYRVRVYTPFGELLPGMAYLVRRLLENTANESFLRQGFVEGIAEDKLLQDPATIPSAPEKPKASHRFVNEPDAAFHQAATRMAFSGALDAVRKQLGASYPLSIGGKAVKGEAAEVVSHDPSDRATVVGRCAGASAAQADAAVAAAKAAFPAWRDTPVAERAALLRKAAQIVRTRRHEFSAWEVFECGKPAREADGDVAEAIDFLEYYALEAERLMAPVKRVPVPGEIDEDYLQPRGIAAVIAPWNFPLAILTGMTAAALATGNTVVMKPAEQSPVIAAKLMDVLKEAGFPAGTVNSLPGAGETVGARLVVHPDVNLIVFTGSMAVGLAINAEAAKTRQGMQAVKKVVCEMGGKNAVIVDSDADLDEAVLGVLRSAFGYAGQKCSACSRAIVVGDAYEPFLKRLAEAAQSIRVAPAADPGCAVPPVIDEEARARILKMIARGRSEAKVAVEMPVDELAKRGSFVGPVVFRDVAPAASIAQEEIFGPVLCVMPAKDFDEALKIALDVPYALTGGLFSRSPLNIERARKEFRVGNLYINRGTTGAKVDRQPFGGFKMSGIGSKAGGPQYLHQFVEPRTVTENTLRRGFAPEEKDGG